MKTQRKKEPTKAELDSLVDIVFAFKQCGIELEEAYLVEGGFKDESVTCKSCKNFIWQHKPFVYFKKKIIHNVLQYDKEGNVVKEKKFGEKVVYTCKKFNNDLLVFERPILCEGYEEKWKR